VTYFVKLLGSKDWPMPDDAWDRDPEMWKEVRFPKGAPPRDVSAGDELIYYAVGGYKRIFGASRLDGPAVQNLVHSNPEIARRWPYAAPVTVREDARIERVQNGPLLSEVGPGLQQQIGEGVSHFEIGRPDFDRAISLLRKAKAAEKLKVTPGARS
jgi:hypothetical protein